MDGTPAARQASDTKALLLNMLQKCYWTECFMTEVLEQLKTITREPGISSLLQVYQDHIVQQAAILTGVFKMVAEKAEPQLSTAFENIWREGAQHVYQASPGSPLRDTAIIIAVQQMAANKAANYQIIASFLRMLNHGDIAAILESCLMEEKERQAELTEIAASELFNTKPARQ